MFYKLIFILVIFLLSPFDIVYASDNNTKSAFKLSYVKAQYPQFPWESFLQSFKKQISDGEYQDIDVELLKGGFSADALFKIKTPDKTYVLRFIGDHRTLEKRKIISHSFEWAGLKGFGPRNYLIDRDKYSFILSEFIEGQTLTLEDTKNKKILLLLGSIISKIHSTRPPLKDDQEFSQFIFGQKWCAESIKSSKVIGPSILKEAYRHWKQLSTEINQDKL